MGRYSSDAPVQRGSLKDVLFSSSAKTSGRHSGGGAALSAATVLASTKRRRPVLAAIAVPTAAVAAVAVAGVVGAPSSSDESSVVSQEQAPELQDNTQAQEQETRNPEDSAIVKAAQKAAGKQAEAGSASLKTPSSDSPDSSKAGGTDVKEGVSSESSGGMTTPAENKAYAKSILSASDFSCANELVMRESEWKTNADNPSSSAYGVPQALPGSKMASEGADWKTNGKTQFNWMIKYVDSRYGGFCEALSHSHANGWY